MIPTAAQRPCLLLVDDTVENLQILTGLLKADYDLKVATRGEQALKICEQVPHLDLVLLDVMMPEMDGFEVCRRIRSTEATRDLPVIFLTAKTEVDDVVHGFELGANDFVTKPFRPPELLARVRSHLLIRAQQREIAAKNTELKEILQIVSHDVANHFAILGMSLELVERVPGMPFSKVQAGMTAAARNGIALTNLVREMRRAEEKGLRLQSVSLTAVLDETLLLASARLSDKRLTVQKEGPEVQVVAEAVALTNSVFGNIVSNAIKFSHPGDVIQITTQATDGWACIRIRDRGIGMPPEALARLFDVAKSQSRLGTSGERGTGFGMPVMQKFLNLFGGTVEVTSREADLHPHDHGTAFDIRLKIAEPS